MINSSCFRASATQKAINQYSHTKEKGYQSFAFLSILTSFYICLKVSMLFPKYIILHTLKKANDPQNATTKMERDSKEQCCSSWKGFAKVYLSSSQTYGRRVPCNCLSLAKALIFLTGVRGQIGWVKKPHCIDLYGNQFLRPKKIRDKILLYKNVRIPTVIIFAQYFHWQSV